MNIFTGLLDLIYPALCINCGNYLTGYETGICNICKTRMPYTRFHDDPVNDMSRALWGRADIDFATAFLYFRKRGMTQKVLHQLKYKGREDIGLQFGNLFGAHIADSHFLRSCNYLLPVPLHKAKEATRGYNQSKLICEGMEQTLQIPLSDNLIRTRYSDTQTRKHRFERWLNVNTKFMVKNPQQLEGKRVLLVDDVFTTGATIEACCQVLSQIKDISIGVATLAIAVN